MPIKPMIGRASETLYYYSMVLERLAEDEGYLIELIEGKNLDDDGELKTLLSRVVRNQLGFKK